MLATFAGVALGRGAAGEGRLGWSGPLSTAELCARRLARAGAATEAALEARLGLDWAGAVESCAHFVDSGRPAAGALALAQALLYSVCAFWWLRHAEENIETPQPTPTAGTSKRV